MVDRKKYSQTITPDSGTRSPQIRLDVRYLRIPTTWSVEEIPASEIRPEPSTYVRENFLGFEDGWGRVDQRGVKIPPRKDDTPDWRYRLVPAVSKSAKWDVIKLNPFDLRTQFLKLDIDNQEKTLDFLNVVGVWNINTQTGEESMRIDRTVGHQYVSGFATTFAVGDLKRAQQRIRHQMEWLAKDT